MTDIAPQVTEKNIDPVRAQAARYMTARFGPDYVYKAPETFENVLERWIWAVGADEMGLAEQCMIEIEAALVPMKKDARTYEERLAARGYK